MLGTDDYSIRSLETDYKVSIDWRRVILMEDRGTTDSAGWRATSVQR